MVQHKNIANILEKRIQNHVYPPLSQIPTQNELADEFNTSRVTIKKAIDTLIAEGLLVSNRGSGTFVMSNPLINEMNFSGKSYTGLTATMGEEKDRISSAIIKFESDFPNSRLQKILLLGETSPIYHIIRLRNLDNEPFQLEHTFMPIDVIPGVNKEILFHSIYSYIQDSLGLKIGSSYRIIKAVKPDELDITYLDCKTDDPILEVEQVVYLDNGVPFEYSRSRHRYDKGGIVINNQIDL
ncbi:GntR family transcriptional regulator [Sporolactobacillus pectinivorans]|uniref:GntR family transcriptional regulator n=1 Tax=Sporolactobacillus pectinivorans TaxID=1591408 RepID=UPI000C25F13B|nr:GntR family transcriptional regulator [Sporolactobacillus pectinivorans]